MSKIFNYYNKNRILNDHLMFKSFLSNVSYRESIEDTDVKYLLERVIHQGNLLHLKSIIYNNHIHLDVKRIADVLNKLASHGDFRSVDYLLSSDRFNYSDVKKFLSKEVITYITRKESLDLILGN